MTLRSILACCSICSICGTFIAPNINPSQVSRLSMASDLAIDRIQNPKDSIPYPPCDTTLIPVYTSYSIEQPITVDGHLNEPVWQKVRRSESFRDLVTGGVSPYNTEAAVLWDSSYLYFAYWIQEPNITATLVERDAPIYRDNDVELFIAGHSGYYELEINSYGTIYEVFFIWESAYQSDGYHQVKEFDLSKPGAKTFNGVGYRNHPRGGRFGFWNWDCPGLQTAVSLDGTINDDSDVDVGWFVEVALPWQSLKYLSLGKVVNLPPQDGDIWRLDFSRFNQYKTHSKDSGGWAWSPHGVWDSHVPECFVKVEFSTDSLSID